MAFGEVGTSLSKIKANSLNLAGTYGFSGTVSGFDDTPLVLISTFTSDGSDATASFTSGIDSTYKEYLFVFNNLHPSAETNLQFNGSSDTGSNYNVTKTTTLFTADHNEGDSGHGLNYNGSRDLAQGTGNVNLAHRLGSDNDQSASGTLHFFDISNTTFVKHFFGIFNHSLAGDTSINNYVAGYGNTTSAIDAVKFVMSSGNIDSGTIKLYGIKGS